MISKLFSKLKQLDKKRRIRKAAKRLNVESYDSIEDLFTDYYKNQTWSGGGKETVSGSGSTVKGTESLRIELPGFLARSDMRRVFDAPCGDFNWFNHVDRSGFEYIGGDIVKEMVEANSRKYGDQRTTFVHFDIVRDSAPEADVWFCREVLLHFSYQLIFEFLGNYVRSGIPYLLVSNHYCCSQNIDIPTGTGRPVNLEISPFNLPPAIDYLEDNANKRRPMRLQRWDRSTIEAALAKVAASTGEIC